ncbi:substrate-binding periplasmic protein [Maridesulfovibrio frigidus]|uniref:substrate-binding periplasmic protein n=1 Tax=Maridesulfovibrio frigidus TaxID=340956 RepID=UPI0004E1FEE8|nr:hypothetical protein [Maridesulfovibrio frigidus]
MFMLKIKNIFFFLIITAFMVSFETSIYAEVEKDYFGREMTFVYSQPLEFPKTQALIRLYSEVFRRAGIRFRYLNVPSKRAMSLLCSGEVDGDLGRLYSFMNQDRCVVRVGEPNFSISITAFSANPNISLNGWESLRGSKYKAECFRGELICLTRISDLLPPDQCSEVNTVHQGIQKLFKGRTDVFIKGTGAVDWYLKSDQFKIISQGRKIYKSGVMERTTSHMFLYRRHAYLASKIAEILRDMKKDGSFQQLMRY